MHSEKRTIRKVADAMETRPVTRRELWTWISLYTPLLLPRHPTCPGHVSPFEYLAHTYFEQGRAADAIVWACRGGGKTMLGAVATLLDLLFKPGIQVRILGGSLEQSDKMYAYLRGLVAREFEHLLARPPTRRRLQLVNGSAVEILAQSDRAVRGTRVQKLRCDEVELFDPAIWQAAQLVTRCMPGNDAVRGAVEALSTMHRPGGLMQNMLFPAPGKAGPAAPPTHKTFTWCVWDVVARCHPERTCANCPLWAECGGRAKAATGFVPVDDLLAMKGRVSQATWAHEMLCHPPKLENAVFPAFSREAHVRRYPLASAQPRPGETITLDGRTLAVEAVVAGVDFGFHVFVCLWVVMLRDREGRRVVWVVDEFLGRRRVVERNADAVRLRPVPREAAGSGGDAAAGGGGGTCWKPSTVYCDVAGEGTNSQTGRPDQAVLRAAGFRVKSSAMEIEAGLAMINDLLEPGEGPPRLLIDPRCAELVAAFEGYRRAPGGKAVKDGVHDHSIDALRYALVNHDREAARIEVRGY
jgi:hypothetical protein